MAYETVRKEMGDYKNWIVKPAVHAGVGAIAANVLFKGGNKKFFGKELSNTALGATLGAIGSLGSDLIGLALIDDFRHTGKSEHYESMLAAAALEAGIWNLPLLQAESPTMKDVAMLSAAGTGVSVAGNYLYDNWVRPMI